MKIPVIQALLREQAERNSWTEYHTPGNLAQAISVEAAELLDLWQWDRDFSKWPTEAEAAGEVADIAIFLLRYCDVTGIDLEQAIRDKIAYNDTRTVKGPRYAD